MIANCSPEIERYIKAVEKEEIRTCKEQKALVKIIRNCFETEDIYVDREQLKNYLSLQKYFTFEQLFSWEEFIIGLHLCTYWTETKSPRWPELLCLTGRGTGKDGFIAFTSTCLSSEYNGINKYDVDICANNEEQGKRPVKDIIESFEQPKFVNKLKKFFYWTKEQVVSRATNSTIKGRTNNPKGKDGLRSGYVCFNEIHQYENYQNIDVFTTGLGKVSHPRIGYFTTQGDVREGPLDDLVETAEGILFNGDDDNGLLCFICKLDDIEEVHDSKNWEKANPSLPYLPHLMEEIQREYVKWKKNPDRLPAFITKRMNIPSTLNDLKVTDWENIKATNKEIPDLTGWSCVCGVDYMKTTDFASCNLHFKDGDKRYDINHTWICANSKDLHRIKAPYKEWDRENLVTIVDDVEINPSIITDYIQEAKMKYNIISVAIDDYRYALFASALSEIGVDRKVYKNLKLVKLWDIMKVVPVIESCFANNYFHWGDNPPLRWATNNTKLIRYGRKKGSEDDADIGNFVYGKIEAKSRKTDPFMALVASMTLESELQSPTISSHSKMEVFNF